MRRWASRRRGAIYITLLVLITTGANLQWTAREVNQNSAQRCASVLAEAQIPLPRPVQGNPSRIWEARFEYLQQRRAHDLGCK